MTQVTIFQLCRDSSSSKAQQPYKEITNYKKIFASHLFRFYESSFNIKSLHYLLICVKSLQTRLKELVHYTNKTLNNLHYEQDTKENHI